MINVRYDAHVYILYDNSGGKMVAIRKSFFSSSISILGHAQ